MRKMRSKPPSYREPTSSLVRLFIERSGSRSQCTPHDVLATLIRRTYPKERGRAGRCNQLELFLSRRNVKLVEIRSDLDCDGLIEPLGTTFAEGFKMVLKKGPAEPRVRFTMAHEACHTFFYELVPELKFIPHEENQEEEQLCNFGAAMLLIPEVELRRRANSVPICLESLERLAEQFVVSLPTMVLRLQSLGLWCCQLSIWHRMVNGHFALDKIYGDKRIGWQWEDESILERACKSSTSVFGRTFVSYEDSHAVRRYRPISYQMRRTPHGVVALWAKSLKPRVSELPLFLRSASAGGSTGIAHFGSS